MTPWEINQMLDQHDLEKQHQAEDGDGWGVKEDAYED